MKHSSITSQRAYGAAILARLSDVTVPAALKPRVASFKKVHEQYESASEAAEAARKKRDEAIDAIGAADDRFDASVGALADKIVGAGLGSRQNPFKAYSRHAPSELTAMAYAAEPKAIRELGDALVQAKPPSEVAKALSVCLKNANALETALDALTKPEAAYVKALAAREALLPAWDKALRSLRKHADVAWEDDPATQKAVFAPPSAVQAPKKRRAKKAAKNDDAATTPS